jgi:hypothetical protein
LFPWKGNLIRSNKAAIIAQLSKPKAERQPQVMRVYYYRVTDKPDSELTVCTDHSLEEVREGLINRYGDKLITVYPYMARASNTKH